eukprot:350667-Chlamydomonas_euryale.AAC.4
MSALEFLPFPRTHQSKECGSGALRSSEVAQGQKPAWHLIRVGPGPIQGGAIWVGMNFHYVSRHGSGGVDDPHRVQPTANGTATARSGAHNTRSEGRAPVEKASKSDPLNPHSCSPNPKSDPPTPPHLLPKP